MNEAPGRSSRRIPLWVVIVYAAFVAVLVPVYLHHYGPTNFLYYCDVALLLTCVGLWVESPALVSACAVGILLPQAAWILDFLTGLVGRPVLGLTSYMFDSGKPLYLRGLSLFHGWLPLVLVWAVRRLGYDRRGLWLWIAMAWALMPICYFAMPRPGSHPESPNMPVNINYVFGFSDERAQQWMPEGAYFALLMVGMPLCIFVPTHVALRRLFGQAAGRARTDAPRPVPSAP